MLVFLYKSCDQGYISWEKEVMFPTMGGKGTKKDRCYSSFRITNDKLSIVSKEYIEKLLV